MPLSLTKPRTGSPREAAPAQADEVTCQGWYEEYGEAIYRYLRFHLPTADLAEDLTAEVFLRAVQASHRFDPRIGPPKAWLFRIARNALRDFQRQLRRRQVFSLSGFRDLECDSPSPEERLLLEEEMARLFAALVQLSPKDREVISLSYASDLAATEVAAILGISDTAARTRLWRALNRLRALLSP